VADPLLRSLLFRLFLLAFDRLDLLVGFLQISNCYQFAGGGGLFLLQAAFRAVPEGRPRTLSI